MKHFTLKTSRWLLAMQVLLIFSTSWLALIADFLDPPPHIGHHFILDTVFDITTKVLPLLGFVAGIVNSIFGGPYVSRWLSFALTALVIGIVFFYYTLFHGFGGLG